jgi:O-antigen/teichoic acid export membrane protein
MLGVTAAITAVVALFMGWLGIRIISVFYGVDFSQFSTLVFCMVLTGGLSAAIDFLYQIITVLRRQAAVTRLYAVGFLASIPISYLLVNSFGLTGAVYAAFATMGILLILLVFEYVNIRRHA